MRWLWTVVPGACLLAFVFWEIFQDLFHPTLSGSFSDWVGRTTFRLFRRKPSALSFAGPFTLIVVILSWAFGQAVGFALIYWSAYPSGFQISSPQVNGAHSFWIMLYFSFEVLTTLGLGDVAPRTNPLRLLTAFQALMGFALLTASVSSIILIYPALARMRTLARRTEVLVEASRGTGIEVISENAEMLLNDLAREVIQVRVDFIHFPIVYYFHSDRRRSSLPHSLMNLMRFAEMGSRPDAPERVRLASATLQTALRDLARLLSNRFIRALSPDNPEEVFQAYAKEHVLTRESKRS